MQSSKDIGLYNEGKIQKSVETRLKDIYNIDLGDKRLKLKGVSFGEYTHDPNDWAAIKNAKINRETIGRPYFGDFELEDSSGQVIDRKKVKFGVLPVNTMLDNFMVGGNFYSVPVQFRLKPGAYSRETDRGDFEVFHNVKGGVPMRTFIDPETKKMSVKVRQATVPLYSILNTMGANDTDISRALGKEIYQSNASTDTTKDVNKLYRSLFVKTPPPIEEAKQEIRDYFNKLETTPSVNEATIKYPTSSVDSKYFLSSARKLIDIVRGDEKPDNRDDLLYKDVYSIDDVVDDSLERMKKTHKLDWMVKRKMQDKNDIQRIVNRNDVNKAITGIFTSSDLARFSDQTNPLANEINHLTTTLLGEGGVKSPDLITNDAKQLQPSHMSFLDSAHTPECHDDITQVFTDKGWKLFSDLAAEDKLACKINGALEFHIPTALHRSHYKGKMYGATSVTIDYLVTPNHRMWTRCNKPLRDGRHSSFLFHSAEHINGMDRIHEVSHDPYIGEYKANIDIPYVKAVSNQHKKIGTSFDPVAWASFMGWYLSEGYCTVNPKKNKYMVYITQSQIANPDKCRIIESVLNKLGFHWALSNGDDYVISSKQLSVYLKQFGLSYNKWIPEEFFSAQLEVREALYDAMLMGDGKIGNVRHGKDNWNVDSNYRIFYSSSKLLADGFERLAISLGYPTSRKLRHDNRKDSYYDIHEVSSLLRRVVRSFKHHYYTCDYDGMVYCATVPGGLLLTKRNKHPLWSGNSASAGVTLFMANDTKKVGNKLSTKVINLRTGSYEWLDTDEFNRSPIAYPGEYKVMGGRWVPEDNEIVCVDGGKHVVVHPGLVKYMVASPDGLFDITSNTVPFIQSNQANRLLTSSKMATQASTLHKPENPLVDVTVRGKSVLDDIGSKYSIHSKDAGMVQDIGDDYITVSTNRGLVKHNMPRNMPLNSDAFLDSKVVVNVGDSVKRGQLLADTNSTLNGKLATGVNLNVAYLPYKGLNYEDAVVISQSAADRLASEHIHRIHVPKESVLDLKKYRAYSPYDISDSDESKYDEYGIIRKGTTIQPNDIVAASLQKRVFSMADSLIQRLRKSAVEPMKANPVFWDRGMTGEVTDVQKVRNGTDIYVKTIEPVLPGDKLVGRHGNKATVSTILPDHLTPRTAAGEPIDIIMDSLSVHPRINLGQLLETSAGKLAKGTGTTYSVENFDGKDHRTDLVNDLFKNNIPEKDDLFDPSTGKTLPGVFTGVQYIHKLKHQVENKISSRGIDEPYNINQQPTRGKGTGGQSLDNLTTNILLAHNARNILKDSFSIKNNPNREYWRAIQNGDIPPAPKVPYEYGKFESMLKGMGVNTEHIGTSVKLSPLTDAQTRLLSSGEIVEPYKTFRLMGDDIKPDKKGLFGDNTGGTSGNVYNHIELPTRIAAPAYKSAIKSVLGITDAEYDKMLEE